MFYLLSLVCHFLFLSCAFNLQNPAVGQCYVVGQLLPLLLTLIMTTPGKEHFFVSHDPLILKFRFLFPSFQWHYFKTVLIFMLPLNCVSGLFSLPIQVTCPDLSCLIGAMCCRILTQVNAWGEALTLHELYSSSICHLIRSLLENLASPNLEVHSVTGVGFFVGCSWRPFHCHCLDIISVELGQRLINNPMVRMMGKNSPFTTIFPICHLDFSVFMEAEVRFVLK